VLTLERGTVNTGRANQGRGAEIKKKKIAQGAGSTWPTFPVLRDCLRIKKNTMLHKYSPDIGQQTKGSERRNARYEVGRVPTTRTIANTEGRGK